MPNHVIIPNYPDISVHYPARTEADDDEEHAGDGRLSVEHDGEIMSDGVQVLRVLHDRRRDQETHRVPDLP